MKKFLFALSMAACAITSAQSKETVQAQKVVITERGDTSIGILIPDRGMADPHVWIENGRLYAFCGGDQSWEPVNTWIMNRWELWSTDNLTEWQHELTVKPTQTYIGNKPNCWAGDLCERNGKYYWFFSNRNLNTGVMVADKITGPYKDLLGEPLLTPENSSSMKPYDPEIFVENGEYHICYGAGVYYMARLSEDMKSLKDKPRAIKVVTKDGKHQSMGDKPTLFKHNGWYYLVSGGRYAMSRELYGTYTYVGDMGGGGHCSFFQWGDKKQWYKIHETSDTNFLYRGIGLQPIYFNEDGTMKLAQKRAEHPGNGRDYTFAASEMGWHAHCGTSLKYDKNSESIKGRISKRGASIESAIFLMSSIKHLKGVSLDIRNQSSATTLRVGIMSYPNTKKGQFPWNVYPVESDWSKGSFVEVNVVPNSKEMQHIEIPISKFENLQDKLMQLRVEFATDTNKGKWEIDNIIVR